MTDREETYERILFHLDRTEDDWPPAATETLWAQPTGDGYYEIDNIPFFVKSIAVGDVVAAHMEDGMLTFDRLVRPSGHSTLSVIVSASTTVQTVRDELRAMGCDSELSHLPRLFSVDVPPEVDLRVIQAYLVQGNGEDRWDYAELCLGHEESPTDSDGQPRDIRPVQ
jgi:hypothetical protein